MTTKDFQRLDLSGARFERIELVEARLVSVDLTRARLRNVDLTDVTLDGVYVPRMTLNGEVVSLVVNGIDVAPFVEAELDRRHPEHALLRPTDADGYRTAYAAIERMWLPTLERAGSLEPALLHERVDGQWSFTQTLRHLLFATDIWVGRVILGDPRPWDALSLPYDEMRPDPQVPWDREVEPSLDAVLALRESRAAMVRRVLDDLTDERLAAATTPVEGPGWPPAHAFEVAQALDTVLNEEWWHHRYAVRDLDALEARGAEERAAADGG